MGNQKLEKLISAIDSIEDIDSLIEKERKNENRKYVIDLLLKQKQRIMLRKYGYNFDLLKKLLDVPFYTPNKQKENFTEEQKQKILRRDNHTCQLCYSQTKKLVVHHIYPQGSADDDNLVTLCVSCHSAVHRLLRAKGYPYYYERGE